MKEKTCKICRVKFAPSRPMQVVCGPQCASAYAWREKTKAEVVAAREDRKAVRLKLEKLKTKSDHAREAQSAFNAFIRARDKDEPCISCNRLHQGQWHAGHYRSVGSHPELRYSELNVHKQCAPCNNHKAGNVVEYRLNLLEKIGSKALAWLEGPHDPQKYTVEELQQIKATYKQKLKELNGG